MGLVVSAARALDFLEVQAVSGRALIRDRRTFGLHARQVAGSEAITLRDDAGRLAVVAGLYDDGQEIEAWFGAGVALRANLRGVLLRLASALAHVGVIAPGAVLTAYIDPASVAGDRLARGLGFNAEGLTDTALGPLKTWRRRFP